MPAHENRAPAAWPTAREWSTKRFERWFNDRLGFRRELLELHAASKWDLLGVPSSSFIAVGPNGWLFLRQSSPFDQPSVRRTGEGEHLCEWADQFAERRRLLAERGIRYLVVIAPDKQTIYPEELPGSLRFLGDSPLLDEFQQLTAERGVDVLDLCPVLRQAKAGDHIYLKYDTHWNGIGAWHAAKALLERIRGPKLDLAEYTTASHPFPAPDLVRYLGNVRLEEAWDTMVPTRRISPALPKAVFLHDSFGIALSEHAGGFFAELVCIPTIALPLDAIDRERPAIVIQEVVERALKARPPGRKD